MSPGDFVESILNSKAFPILIGTLMIEMGLARHEKRKFSAGHWGIVVLMAVGFRFVLK